MKARLFLPIIVPVALVAILITGFNNDSAVPTVEELSADLARELTAQGYEPDVIDCVVGIAKRRFRYGSLDDTTRDELVGSCQTAQDGLNNAEPEILEPDPEPLGGVLDYGDDPELDRLWDRCEAGEGSACNELFDKSPLGSVYEEFGVSCGRRQDVLDCTELDRSDEPVSPVTAGG